VPYWLRHRVTESYTHGRTTFLGDAAHVMGPFLGQGVCHALRDASNVVWKLSLVLHGKAPLALMATVHPEMVPIAERLVKATAMVMDACHTRNPTFAAFRDAVIKMVPHHELGDRTPEEPSPDRSQLHCC
jgi:3-(3-hydroxy-phenyl)propionate hydroxylase